MCRRSPSTAERLPVIEDSMSGRGPPAPRESKRGIVPSESVILD